MDRTLADLLCCNELNNNSHGDLCVQATLAVTAHATVDVDRDMDDTDIQAIATALFRRHHFFRCGVEVVQNPRNVPHRCRQVGCR